MISENVLYKNQYYPARISIGNKLTKGIVSKTHFHSELEFLFVSSGKVKVMFDDSEQIAKKGEIIFINSKAPHSTVFMENGTAHILIQFKAPSVLESELKYLVEMLKTETVSGFVFKKNDHDYAVISKIIMGMAENNEIQNISNSYYIMSEIYLLLSILHKRGFLPDASSFDMALVNKILPVLKFIDENYNEQISLNDMAESLNLNKDYFCRLFKKATGITPVEYLNFVRVSKAEKLFKSDMNLSEIAFSVGFSSVAYFNRTFNKYKNCSPSKYRKIQKTKANKLLS